jgi:XTP/dITP diphosphohydrolase
VESKARERGLMLRDMSLAEMDALWNEAKQKETAVNG